MAGLALIITQQIADRSVAVLAAFLFVASIIMILRMLLLMIFARKHARRDRRHRARALPYPPPGVSVIVPAYNEAAGIAATVRSLVASHYPGDLEVIVVDDGSSDDTAAIASGLRLGNVRVIRQPNGGKPSALNRGLAAARHEICVLVDADTIFRPDALARVVARFSDPDVGAVSGNTKVANRTALLGTRHRWQTVDRMGTFSSAADRRPMGATASGRYQI